MADKSGNGDTMSSSNPEVIKRVEVIMGERPPEPGQKIPTAPNQNQEIDIFENAKPDVKPLVSAQVNTTAESNALTDTEKSEPDQLTSTDVQPAKNAIDIEDEATERAVKGIIAEESDVVLEATSPAFQPPPKAKNPRPSFKEVIKSKWMILAVVAVVALFFAIPYTRYTILGLFIQKDVTITVLDSKLHTPVSGADVVVDGYASKTDQNGVAKIKASLGQQQLKVSKQYFTSYTGKTFVGFSSSKSQTIVNLVATGRQIPLIVLDKITYRPVSGATVTAAGTTAKTNSQGKVTIVLPANDETVDATITLTDYMTTKVTIDTKTTDVNKHTYYMFHAGKVYFLSNQSGKIDVVKVNLDGSGRQVVLAGTGNEESLDTVLLSTRDWKYLVLKAKRDTPHAALYLIDTSNDKVTMFDNGDAVFNTIGWSEHKFVYDMNKNSVNNWSSGKEQLKYYDADRGQLNQLDQTTAEGTQASYVAQNYGNFQIINGELVYSTSWFSTGYDTSALNGKKDAIKKVQIASGNKNELQSFDAADTGYIQSARYAALAAYYGVYVNSENRSHYYNYANQTLTQTTAIDQATFNKAYPSYLISPTATQTFWSDFRDGRNVLLIGDNAGNNEKELPTKGNYAAYGWYTGSYLLVSKDNSQLYAMSSAGLPEGTQPIKVTDYYKPAGYPGYGY